MTLHDQVDDIKRKKERAEIEKEMGEEFQRIIARGGLAEFLVHKQEMDKMAGKIKGFVVGFVAFPILKLLVNLL